MTIRSAFAFATGQVTAAGLRLVGRQGTALPGLVATLIDPAFLRSVAAELRTVLVSGTNGKTTTTNLLMRIVAASGRSVVLNGEGSNLARGIASTLISSPLDAATVGTFEVDEAELPNVAADLHPRTIVLLNLFRDQMDRYGELDATARKWQVLGKLAKTELLVNVDDPNLGWLATQLAGAQTFGIESVVGEKTGRSLPLAHTADAVLSPVSHAPLAYRRVSFSHLGDYRDPKSSFKRPPLDYAIGKVKLNGLDGSAFVIQDAKQRIRLSITTPLPGLFNVYNVAAAAIAALRLGIDRATIEATVGSYHGAFGRFETIALPGGGTLTTLLVKNPVGFDQALSLVRTINHVDQLIVGLNDKLADGTDVSWIWDVDFESLATSRAPIITTGTRAHELANRLHYAGVKDKRLTTVEDLPTAVRRLIHSNHRTTVACLTYTALLDFRHQLAQHGVLAHQFAPSKDQR